MPPRRGLVVPFCSILCGLATVAFAQTRVATPSVQLVSPGGPGAPTLTSACPTFSWAPGDGVVEYELAVFELDTQKQPRSAPILHEAVSGRATSWTPSATKCLAAGREFGWYMREIKQAGEKPGPWTPALAFSVIGHTEANDARKADWDPLPTAPPSGGPGGGGGGGAAGDGNGMNAITIQLTRIEAMLIALSNKPAVSKETCFEIGAELEVGVDGEAKIRGGADGEAGVWAFGNGLKANLKAAAELKFAAGLKGNGSIKRAWCWDPLIDVFPSQSARAVAAPTTAAALTDGEFVARLTALSEQLQLGDDRFGQIMDQLPSFNIGDDAFSPFGSDSPIKTLAAAMPLPTAVRTKLANPGQMIANFTAQRNLCQRNNLPDVIAGVVDNFCDLAADEPFRPLLNRVDGVIDQIKGTTVGPSSALTVVRNTVNTINGTVNTISGKVQDVYDLVCSFFCSNEK